LDTLLLIGGAAILYFLYTKGNTLGNLRFVEQGVGFDFSNPIRPIINLSVSVQNPTSNSVTLMSLAGSFSINGTPAGNISYFGGPLVIQPNAVTGIVLACSLNDISLIAILAQFVQGSASGFTVTVSATANIDNVPSPLTLSYSPVPPAQMALAPAS
jgi:hypothetical protein